MILVTGATGTNGQELVRQLTAVGQDVRALVRDPAKAAGLRAKNVELVAGDFDQPETLDAVLKGVDKAFLLVPVGERASTWQRALIQAAHRARLKHLVKFSAMGADAKAGAIILRMHGETDEFLRSSGVPFTILQPASFFQNMLWSAATIKTQNSFYLPFKNAPQSLVDIRDINAVAAKVLTTSEHAGQTYVITGPEAITLQQVAETLSHSLGRTIQYVDVPLASARDGMRKAMPEWNANAVIELYGVAATVTETVPKVLGRPAISFEQFVRDHLGAFEASPVKDVIQG